MNWDVGQPNAAEDDKHSLCEMRGSTGNDLDDVNPQFDQGRERCAYYVCDYLGEKPVASSCPTWSVVPARCG